VAVSQTLRLTDTTQTIIEKTGFPNKRLGPFSVLEMHKILVSNEKVVVINY
jgi:hypothetical protein